MNLKIKAEDKCYTTGSYCYTSRTTIVEGGSWITVLFAHLSVPIQLHYCYTSDNALVNLATSAYWHYHRENTSRDQPRKCLGTCGSWRGDKPEITKVNILFSFISVDCSFKFISTSLGVRLMIFEKMIPESSGFAVTRLSSKLCCMCTRSW